MRFENKDKLFDYVSSEDYLVEGGNAGVCYGFQMEETDDGYTLTLFFNDQSMSGSKGMGIPETAKPAYDPL